MYERKMTKQKAYFRLGNRLKELGVPSIPSEDDLRRGVLGADPEVQETLRIIEGCQQAETERRRTRSRAYYKAHPEKVRASSATWRIAHPEAYSEMRRRLCKRQYEKHREVALARTKAWREAHPGEVWRISRAYYERHREEHLERSRTWYLAHPGEAENIQRRRRALELRAEGSFTEEEFQELCKVFEYKCAYCGAIVKTGLLPDHMIPLTRGGSNYIENIAPACHSCNSSKGNKTVEEFLEYLEEVLK